jgi:hypothetical protein
VSAIRSSVGTIQIELERTKKEWKIDEISYRNTSAKYDETLKITNFRNENRDFECLVGFTVFSEVDIAIKLHDSND